jgi:hypothetical protein
MPVLWSIPLDLNTLPILRNDPNDMLRLLSLACKATAPFTDSDHLFSCSLLSLSG